MRNLFAAFILVSASSLALAQGPHKRWVVKEVLPDSNVHVRIIDEDLSLRNSQNQISQDVIFNKILSAEEAAQLDTENTALSLAEWPKAGRPLWVPIRNAWTKADEDDYSAWLAANASEAFVQGTGVIVDCADTSLLFRWAYAHDHLLPVANSLSGSGKLFGHFSSSAAWDLLPESSDWHKDERFKAALRYLLDNSYTRTVVNDIAPTLINPNYVRPGSLFLIIRPKDGHAQTIQKVDPKLGIQTIWGNEPASDQIFETPIQVEFQNKLTFGIWRAPRLTNGQWELTPSKEMPGYSLEQYQQNFTDGDDYINWVDGRLGVFISEGDKLNLLVRTFIDGIRQRQTVTAAGVLFCYFKSCLPPSQNYANYSTGDRDARLRAAQNQALTLLAKLGNNDPNVASAINTLQSAGTIVVGTQLTFLNLFKSPQLLSALNPSPQVSYAARWGLEPAKKDANIDFFSFSEVMIEFLNQRDGLVAKKTDTTSFDQNFSFILAQAQAASHSNGFAKSSMLTVQNAFAQLAIRQSAGFCNEERPCDFNSLIWGDGASNQVAKWSPRATDPFALRWGY
jgi:hypothetical protein